MRSARALAVIGLLTGAGCAREAVISAGKTEVDVEGWRQFQSRRAAPADLERGLEELSTRALLAEAARRDGLAREPSVKARLAAAQREIMAQAYLDRELASADREDLLRERYQAGKGELARRRVHVAQVAFHVQANVAGAREAAQSKAARAQARLAGGERFEKVAEEMSDDAVTGRRGGDLGPLLEGEVDAGFFAAAAALHAGQVSKPVESPFGLHLIKALEEPSSVSPSFEEARGALAAQARREAQAKLLERLRRDIGVKVNRELAAPPRAAAGAREQRRGGTKR